MEAGTRKEAVPEAQAHVWVDERERRVLDAQLGVEGDGLRDERGVEGEEAVLDQGGQVATHGVALLQAPAHAARQRRHVRQAHSLARHVRLLRITRVQLRAQGAEFKVRAGAQGTESNSL